MERQRIATWWLKWNDLDWPSEDNLDRIKRRAEGFAKAEPAGVDGCIRVAAGKKPQVFTPFQSEPAAVSLSDGECTIQLPHGCAYAIAVFPR